MLLFSILVLGVPGYAPYRIPMLAFSLFVDLLSLFFILMGYYYIAANIIIIAAMVLYWTAMLLPTEGLVGSEMLACVLLTLAMVPLLIPRSRYPNILYAAVSLVLLLIYAATKRDALISQPHNIQDFVIIFSVAIIGIGFAGYTLTSLNNSAIDRAEAELKERRDAESALSKSERKFREMADLMPQIIFEADVTGAITYLNQAAFRNLGFTEDEIKSGVTMISLVKEKEQLLSDIEHCMKGQAGIGTRYTAVRKNGETFPVETYSTAFMEDGRPAGLRGIIVDISERIKAEEKLRQSEELFKTLVESSPYSVSLSTMDGRLIMVNDSFARQTDLSREALVGKSLDELGSSFEFNQSEISGILDTLRSHGHADNIEVARTDRDGTTRYFLVSLRTITQKENPAILSAAIDITERKNLEKMLKESENLYRSIIDVVPYPIEISDTENRYVFANKAYVENYNLQLDAIIGKTGHEMGFGIEKEFEKKLYEEFSNKGKIVNCEVVMTIPANRKIHTLLSVHLIRINDKPCYITTTVDITERKMLEEKLREYTHGLEFLVDERTKELQAANEELQTTNEE